MAKTCALGVFYWNRNRNQNVFFIVVSELSVCPVCGFTFGSAENSHVEFSTHFFRCRSRQNLGGPSSRLIPN